MILPRVVSEREQQQQRDQQREDAERLGDGETEDQVGKLALGGGWMAFDFAKAFGCPVKLVNDASMQAIGSYKGGRMLFLGLGTGLGSAMIVDNVLEPMELAHLIYKKGKTYEDYLGIRGLERMGKKKWRQQVFKVCKILKAALEADYIVLGGGNVKKMKELPPGARGLNLQSRERAGTRAGNFADTANR